MHFSFDTPEIRDICSTDRIAAERIGAEEARALQSTLADLADCETLEEVFLGDIRVDASKGPLDFLVDVTPSLLLSFRATNQSQAGKAADQVQRNRINRIKIVGLVRVE